MGNVERAVDQPIAIIFANGILGDTDCRHLLEQARLVVAADGGSRHALVLGVTPHVIIGDLDSLNGELSDAVGKIKILRFPVEKDKSDTELALEYVRNQGFAKVVLLGALGGRIDHTLANLTLLRKAAGMGVELILMNGRQRVMLVAGNTKIDGRKGDLLSLVPLTPKVDGIWTEGLKYPLQGEDLCLGDSRGISNVFTAPTAMVTVGNGELYLIHTPVEQV